MNVILIGFKKSGKTTLGKILSSFLNKKFIDIDEIIIELFEDKYKVKKNIFEVYGFLKEKKFRDLETLAFKTVANVNDSIIATSGGCILNEKNFTSLKKTKKNIYLKTSKEILIKRIKRSKNSIFKNINFFEKEYEMRKLMYRNKADMIFLTDNQDFPKLSLQIKKKLNV